MLNEKTMSKKNLASVFGGSQLATHNPKIKRPLQSRAPFEVILRGEKGGLRNARVAAEIKDNVFRVTKKYGVRLHSFENGGNQLTLVIKLPNVEIWSAFIRELSSRVVQTLREKGVVEVGEKYWRYRPLTRPVVKASARN